MNRASPPQEPLTFTNSSTHRATLRFYCGQPSDGRLYPHRFQERKSIRLPGYDYAHPGAYFVTLVTWGRERLFGDVVDGSMTLNEWGRLVNQEWQNLPARYPQVRLDAFVAMPNHLHGIIWIQEDDRSTRQLTTLGAIVGAYKARTTRLINGLHHSLGRPIWQRNYYEHIIRSEREWENIQLYIVDNPQNWEQDEENC